MLGACASLVCTRTELLFWSTRWVYISKLVVRVTLNTINTEYCYYKIHSVI